MNADPAENKLPSGVKVHGGQRPRIMVILGGVGHVLTLQESTKLLGELAQATMSLAHELAKSAATAAVDGALGEVGRQIGAGHRQILLEARSDGLLAADPFLSAIPNPVPDDGL